jgi:hypothetical protein
MSKVQVAATTSSSPTTEKTQGIKTEDTCCPEFTPARIAFFDESCLTFQDKAFVKDKVWCFFYVPLNFGQAMTRAQRKIDQANAAVPPDDFLLLSDMSSPWSSNIYLSVSSSKEENIVPGAEVVHMSGSFLTKVFEGPYSNMGKWIKHMKEYVLRETSRPASFNMDVAEMYAFYATCPGCSKKTGKNYTVLFVKVD